MTPIETILIVTGVLLLVSTVSSKVAGRYGVPALVVFLLLGMLAGSEGIGRIPFDNVALAQAFGVVALTIILFSGGLGTDWPEVRPMLGGAMLLSTLGIGITAGVVGVAAAWILGIPLLQGLLLGAIVSSTDAATVFAILRNAGLRLQPGLRPLLELESGSNDPMAVLLVLAIIGLIATPAATPADIAVLAVLQVGLGAVFGYAIGRVGVWMINNLKLEIEGLYPVLMLSLALLTYGVTAKLHGSGFLAVYIAGVVIGNGRIMFRRSLERFHEGLAWLMQITMFLMLGLLIFPSRLPSIAGVGLLIAAVLIVVARPLSVFVSLALTKLSGREKTFVSWVGLRGAVPIVLATFPLLAGVPHASLLFDVVFFVVLVSVLLQGTTIPVVARWLGIGERAEATVRSPIEYERTGQSSADLIEFIVPYGCGAANRSIVDLGFPPGALIVLINRAGEFIIARGDTVIQEGDVLMVLAEDESLGAVQSILGLPGSSGG